MSKNRLRNFRESQLLTKAELARRAGISTLTIDRIEAGQDCRMDTKRKIILALGLDVADKGVIFGGEASPIRSRSSVEQSRNEVREEVRDGVKRGRNGAR